MSRRPGIGVRWFEKWQRDVFPDDFVVLRGRKMRPPKAYDRYLELVDFETFRAMKRGRLSAGRLHADDNTPDRLKVKEKVKRASIGQLKRGYENDLP